MAEKGGHRSRRSPAAVIFQPPLYLRSLASVTKRQLSGDANSGSVSDDNTPFAQVTRSRKGHEKSCTSSEDSSLDDTPSAQLAISTKGHDNSCSSSEDSSPDNTPLAQLARK